MFRNRSKPIRKKIVVDDDEELSVDVSTGNNTPTTQPIENEQTNEDSELDTIPIKPIKPKKPKSKKTLISFGNDLDEEEGPSFQIKKSKASVKLSKSKSNKLNLDEQLDLNMPKDTLSNHNNRQYGLDELNNLKKLSNTYTKPQSDEDLVKSKFPLEFENIPNIKKSALNEDFISFNGNKATISNSLRVIDDEDDINGLEKDHQEIIPMDIDPTEGQVEEEESEDDEVKRWELSQIQRANPHNTQVVEQLKSKIGPPQHPGTKVVPLPDFKGCKLHWEGVKDTSQVRLKLNQDAMEEVTRNLNTIRNRIETIHTQISDIDGQMGSLKVE